LQAVVRLFDACSQVSIELARACRQTDMREDRAPQANQQIELVRKILKCKHHCQEGVVREDSREEKMT
jgi:hypothetical protein